MKNLVITIVLLVTIGGVSYYTLNSCDRLYDQAKNDLKSGYHDNALKKFVALQECSDDKALMQLYQAKSLQKLGKNSEAEAIFKSLITQQYKLGDVYYQLGLIRLNSNQPQEGIAHLLLAIQKEASNITDIYMIVSGVYYRELQNPQKAHFYLNKLLEIDAQHAKALQYKGIIYANSKEYSQASMYAFRACKLGECFLLEELKKSNSFIPNE
jgi:predicted Zn-dependent protease